MKKTLMVLTFALCASFAFAQTAANKVNQVMAPAKAAQAQDYKSSVFTKDATVLMSCDFSAENTGYSTGTITGGLEGHGESYSYATWRRWANNSESTLNSASSVYSALAQNYFGDNATFVEYMGRYLDTATSSAENGWMMMSLYDQRTPHSGNFNAYIQFDGIDASSAAVVDVEFFQYYRKYYDYCYIDYGVMTPNGVTFNEMEVNVSGVDIDVNGTLWGMSLYTLPLAAANNNNLSIRIRYKSLDSNRGAYGYFWVVDDVQVIGGPADRINQYGQEYVEGNYGQIPQGMVINPAWYANVKNSGANVQNDVTATLYHMNATQDNTTQVATYNNGTVATSSFKGLVCDAAGWLLLDSLEYRGWYGYADHSNPHGAGMAMPTATVGDNYIFATVGNNNVNINYDTMYYKVNGANAEGNYTWAHDNGVLTYSPFNYWMYGFVSQGGNWYVTEDPEEVHYYSPGYTVVSRYTTGNTIPEGWVIKGVELVASPVDGYHSTGAKISAVLIEDAYEGGSVGFQTVDHGANIKTIAAADVNDSTIIGRNSNGYLTEGYHTIYIPFPNQPALAANTSYRIGYSMEEDGYFAVAQEAMGSYRMASPTRPDQYDTIIYFRSNESTAKYAHFFAPNTYQSYIQDPASGREDGNSTFAGLVDMNPMIRMIVGPAVEMPTKNISIECENTEFGEVTFRGEDACGTTVEAVVSSTATIRATSAAGCHATIIVDGEEREAWNDDEETGDPNLQVAYDEDLDAYAYYYSFQNINEDHTIRVVFVETDVSIDPVAAGVRMNLQPNPATSQVNLNIAGVTGMVNCTLVDMSGRVVYNQNINAETAQVINLSNLAKGAYFVRITNDKFSKVEKLIVR